MSSGDVTRGAGSWPSVPVDDDDVTAPPAGPAAPPETAQPAEPETAPVLEPVAASPAEPDPPTAAPPATLAGAPSAPPVGPPTPVEPPAPVVASPTPVEPPMPATPPASVAALSIVAAVAVVLAIAGSVILTLVTHHDSAVNATNAARSGAGSALVAARTETAATLSYDYRHLDADFAAAERGLTPKFRASYAQTAASSVEPLAKRTHAVSTATIAAAGVISAAPSSAKILVYADQTVQNNQLKATSRLDQSVIEVSMVKQNGRWLISNLQPF